jgi:hypothetical protein
MSKKESKLAASIREELGRNFFSANTDPFQYWEVTGVNVDLYPQEGQYAVQIEVKDDPTLNSPLRLFNSEQEAVFFARQYTEFVQRVLNQKDV